MRPYDEQTPEMWISLLGDAAKHLLATTGIFSRHETDPSREGSGRRKLFRIADRRGHQACGDRTDAGNCRQSPAEAIAAVIGDDLGLEHINLFCQVTQLATQRRDCVVSVCWQLRYVAGIHLLEQLGRHCVDFVQLPGQTPPNSCGSSC